MVLWLLNGQTTIYREYSVYISNIIVGCMFGGVIYFMVDFVAEYKTMKMQLIMILYYCLFVLLSD